MQPRKSILFVLVATFLPAFSGLVLSQDGQEVSISATGLADSGPGRIHQQVLRLHQDVHDGLVQAAAETRSGAAAELSPRASEDVVRDLRARLARLRLSVRDLGADDAQSLAPDLFGLELQLRNLELAIDTGKTPPLQVARSAAGPKGAPLPVQAIPVNDDCANATVIGNGSFMFDTTMATNDGDASCDFSSSSPDIWFKYVAPADGEIDIDSFGSGFSTVLSTHAFCPGTTLNQIACSFGPINLGFATAGSEILVRVSGFADSTGMGTLNVGPPTGISGTVTEEATGNPITSGFVSIRNQAGFFSTSVSLDAMGQYRRTGILPGDYSVTTSNRSGFIDELFDDVICPAARCDTSSGTPVVVTRGVVTAVDFALAAGGSFSGTITDASTGNPASNVEIQVFDDQGDFLLSEFADGSGNYSTSTGLPTGTYLASTFDYSGGFIDEVYDNIICLGCDRTIGTPIAVTIPNDTPGIDFALEPGGSLSGTVTEASTGLPLSYIDIDVFDAQGNNIPVSADTNGAGNYVADGLPSGTYFVIADPSPSLGFIDELYDDIPCFGCDPTTGTPVVVTALADTPGIDFALEEPGSLSGTITDAVTGAPLPHILIEVRDTQGNFIRSSGSTGDGTYSVTGLPPGTVFALTIVTAYYGGIGELYDNIPCPNEICNLSSGTPITIQSNTDTPNIDFALEQESSVSGRVTSPTTGHALSGVIVNLFNSSGNLVGNDTTDLAGLYSISGLVPGTYFAMTTNFFGFEEELFQNMPCPGGSCDPTAGTPIITVSNTTTTGIDFILGEELVVFTDGFESGDTSAWSP